jgi:hypothetical protein
MLRRYNAAADSHKTVIVFHLLEMKLRFAISRHDYIQPNLHKTQCWRSFFAPAHFNCLNICWEHLLGNSQYHTLL